MAAYMEKDHVDAKHIYPNVTDTTTNQSDTTNDNDIPIGEAAADPDKRDMYRMGKEQEFRARFPHMRWALVWMLTVDSAYIPSIHHDNVHFHGASNMGSHSGVCVSAPLSLSCQKCQLTFAEPPFLVSSTAVSQV
jgi:hypothetical protein